MAAASAEQVRDAIDAFLAQLTDARQASAHTLRAYRHELNAFCAWPTAAPSGTLSLTLLTPVLMRLFIAERAGFTHKPAKGLL